VVVHAKLMVGAGIAVAGLGLIGAGAGATFTAQVGATTTITTGGLGLSLNGLTGSDLQLPVDSSSLGSHFKPISTKLLLKNTGTLDMASSFLDVSDADCDGGANQPLARALHARLTDGSDHKVVYAGSLCALAGALKASSAGAAAAEETTRAGEQGFICPPAHLNVGGQLPMGLGAGKSTLYRFVLEPGDGKQGLPPTVQDMRTSVKLIFRGFDY
jgi:hypothetical protein